MPTRHWPLGDPFGCRASEWVGVVLAGGLSSRMGADKSRLELAGKPLIERAMDVVKQALRIAFIEICDSQIYISGNFPQYACIADDEPGLGPMGGIISVTRRLNSMSSQAAGHQRCLLFIPVDMPLLKPSTLTPLIWALVEARKDAAQFQGFPLPFCLRASDHVLRVLEQFIKPGCGGKSQRSVGQFLTQIGCVQINRSVEQCDEMANINTPEEWRRLTGALEKVEVKT